MARRHLTRMLHQVRHTQCLYLVTAKKIQLMADEINQLRHQLQQAEDCRQMSAENAARLSAEMFARKQPQQKTERAMTETTTEKLDKVLQVKVARASREELDWLEQFVREMQGNLNDMMPSEFADWVAEVAPQLETTIPRVVLGYRTLVDNLCAPDTSHLAPTAAVAKALRQAEQGEMALQWDVEDQQATLQFLEGIRRHQFDSEFDQATPPSEIARRADLRLLSWECLLEDRRKEIKFLKEELEQEKNEAAEDLARQAHDFNDVWVEVTQKNDLLERALTTAIVMLSGLATEVKLSSDTFFIMDLLTSVLKETLEVVGSQEG